MNYILGNFFKKTPNLNVKRKCIIFANNVSIRTMKQTVAANKFWKGRFIKSFIDSFGVTISKSKLLENLMYFQYFVNLLLSLCYQITGTKLHEFKINIFPGKQFFNLSKRCQFPNLSNKHFAFPLNNLNHSIFYVLFLCPCNSFICNLKYPNPTILLADFPVYTGFFGSGIV